ncbi:conjugal transfer protein TraK [Hymenobacter jeollabukensis]|uniref:Conjugal transfer protein TraK n=1 Tax=Hymenobacter jeollabukensis TaxID=2025313 RepID=A0A5R8WJZ1_9BACT|nr:conjugal transfer protein TraK [Hymenobacter jeollabukensis]TLM88792.1 conjugal transfer protein TraK [Hymenobacter jeollabukensis]
MRNIALGAIGLALVVCLAAGGLVMYAYGSVGQRVYVVGSQGTQAALAANPEEHTDFELRNLVRTFAQYMFQHDQYTFKDNLNMALPLIDEMGGRRIYDGFKKGDVLGNYTKFGARTSITIDSIVIDSHSRPKSGRLYLRQRAFVGDRQSQPTPMGCSFRFAETNRSNKNPFGVILTSFDYFLYNPGMSKAEKQILEDQARRDAEDLARAKAGAAAAQAGTEAQ